MIYICFSFPYLKNEVLEINVSTKKITQDSKVLKCKVCHENQKKEPVIISSQLTHYDTCQTFV